MPIIREWRCADCGTTGETMGPLEDVVCPNCSSQEAERVFLTPPGLKSDRTKFNDKVVRDLAQTHNLSDVSNKDGESVMSRHGQRGPQQSHARWSQDASQVLNSIPQQHRDGFSGMGRFGQPQAHVVARHTGK